MKKSFQSLGHALSGLVHAIKQERNLRMFILLHLVLLLIAIAIRVDILSMVISTFVAGLFVVVELLNTAIERLSDTFDDEEKTRLGGHYHHGIKLTKDVSSAAALVMLLLYAGCVLLIAGAYGTYFLAQR